MRTISKQGELSPSNCDLAARWGLSVHWRLHVPRIIVWPSATNYMVVLHGDGSVVADQGTYGGLIRTAEGEAICGYHGKGDKVSVILMELAAIKRGLALCLDLEFTSVSIRSDSKIAVDTIRGKSAALWESWVLISDIHDQLAALDRWEISHVWREQNQPADHLASLPNQTHETLLNPCNFDDDLLKLVANDANKCIYLRH